MNTSAATQLRSGTRRGPRHAGAVVRVVATAGCVPQLVWKESVHKIGHGRSIPAPARITQAALPAVPECPLNLVPICYPASGCVPQSGAVSGGVGELVTWTTFEPSAFALKIPSVSSMNMPKMISVPSGDQPGSNAR
jgi:hypothetical protein